MHRRRSVPPLSYVFSAAAVALYWYGYELLALGAVVGGLFMVIEDRLDAIARRLDELTPNSDAG
jgi:hypothetical protein